RLLRRAPVTAPPAQATLPAAALHHAGSLPPRAASPLRRVAVRLLVDADDDRHAPAVRGGHDRLHPGRDPLRGARPGGGASRVRELPLAGADAASRGPDAAPGRPARRLGARRRRAGGGARLPPPLHGGRGGRPPASPRPPQRPTTR